MSAYAYGSGRLNDHDRAEIERLSGLGFSFGRIAQLLKRHQSTVLWFMYTRGLKAPRPTPAVGRVYVRANGSTVRQWGQDEEADAVRMRTAGRSFRAIAAALSQKYRAKRTAHSVQVRLIMIAAREDYEDDKA